MRKPLALLVALFLGSVPAWAVLGQPVQSVSLDQSHFRGVMHSVSRAGYSVEQINAPDGTVVKEYVSPAGMVFGVSWQGPAMPNLSQLLGAYFPQFQQASQSNARKRRAVVMRTHQFVIESGGHIRAFHGRAYVPGLLPANLSSAVVQ